MIVRIIGSRSHVCSVAFILVAHGPPSGMTWEPVPLHWDKCRKRLRFFRRVFQNFRVQKTVQFWDFSPGSFGARASLDCRGRHGEASQTRWRGLSNEMAPGVAVPIPSTTGAKIKATNATKRVGHRCLTMCCVSCARHCMRSNTCTTRPSGCLIVPRMRQNMTGGSSLPVKATNKL